MTSPEVPLYSSITITMWLLRERISRRHSAARIDSGMYGAGRRMSARACRPGRRGVAEHVLGICQADHLVDGAVVDRDAREAGAQDQLQHLLERGLQGDGHLGVRPGHHDLAQDGVAELEDRVDHLPLFLFDDVVPLGLVDHRLDLVLGHDRAVFQALARSDHVADGDQQPGQLPQAGQAGQEVHERGHEQRRPVGVLDGVGLGRDLGADEGDHGRDRGRHDHPEPASDDPARHRGEQGRWRRTAPPAPAAGPG